MAEEDDFLTLIEDEAAEAAPASGAPWKVAIIDDDAAVHDGTRFALYDYALSGQRLQIFSAYSAEQGRALMRAHPDMAVGLPPVGMGREGGGPPPLDHIPKENKKKT